MSTDGHVLDLPIEQQREAAALFGLSLEKWRERMIESDKEADALRAELDANRVRYQDLTPEEREAYDRFQARVDSEVMTNAVLSRRTDRVP